MTLAHLVSCPSCTRHVRASEASCPFCAHAIPEGVRAVQPRRPPAERLSRAALYAFSVGSLTVAAACSSGGSSPQPQPLYGGPPVDSGRSPQDTGTDLGVGQPLYGASFDGNFPGVDAGEDAAGDDASDGGMDGPLGQPFYGAAQDGGVVLPEAGGHDDAPTIGQPSYGIGVQLDDGQAPSGH